MLRAIKRSLIFGVLPLVVLGGVLAWVERDTLCRWYYLRQLTRARGEEVARWAERTASLDTAAVPGLLTMLAHDDQAVCASAEAGLKCLRERWGQNDPRTGELIQQAVKEFARFSTAGQQVVIDLAEQGIAASPDCPDCLVCAATRLLGEVHHQGRECQLGSAVEFALAVVSRSKVPSLLCAAREIARSALRSPDATTRVRGLRLAIHPGMELAREALPLLSDRDALVRRAAMLAVGEDVDTLPTDTLMTWLHDPDEEVRRLCETALRGPRRGLKSSYVRLARLITDPRWEVRLTVLDHLLETDNLDLAMWLRRLSHDASPAVRAAAVRAACAWETADMKERLDEMARLDPSPTVAELARHYLTQRSE